MDEVRLHIVYLRDGGMMLTKKRYAGWRDIQDEYEGYLTSLGPWAVDEVVEFLEFEYPNLQPVGSLVHAFAASDADTMGL